MKSMNVRICSLQQPLLVMEEFKHHLGSSKANSGTAVRHCTDCLSNTILGELLDRGSVVVLRSRGRDNSGVKQASVAHNKAAFTGNDEHVRGVGDRIPGAVTLDVSMEMHKEVMVIVEG